FGAGPNFYYLGASPQDPRDIFKPEKGLRGGGF
ncbi:MAG: hypothetical protein ACI80I_003355, partial [Akkermansiaceae bacterium]